MAVARLPSAAAATAAAAAAGGTATTTTATIVIAKELLHLREEDAPPPVLQAKGHTPCVAPHKAGQQGGCDGTKVQEVRAHQRGGGTR
jgi:hypothetical protein